MMLIGVAESPQWCWGKKAAWDGHLILEIALKSGRHVPEDSVRQINRLGSAALSRQCYSFTLKLVRGRQAGQAWGESEANALQWEV